MNARMIPTIVVFTVLILALAGCAPPAAAPAEVPPTATPVPPTATPETVAAAVPTVNPISAVIMDMADRFNAGDLDGVMEYFDDNAMLYFFGLPPTGTEVYKGKEQIRPVWEDNIANHLVLEVDILSVEDAIVTAQVKTWHDFTRQLGVAPLDATEIYEIRDGKIVSDAWILSEESLTRIKAALAEAMPEEPAPETAVETPVSELTVTFADGTCSYAGPLALPAYKDVLLTMDVQDQDKALYALTLFTLDPDKDFLDLMASTVRDGPPLWSNMFSIKEIGPGTSETYHIMATEGPVYGVCWSQPPAMPIGAVGPFTVSPVATATPPTQSLEIPESDLIVTLAEGECTLNSPLNLKAGENTVTMVVDDSKHELYGFALYNLSAGKNRFDLIKAFKAPSLPNWAKVIAEHDAMPGEIKTYSVTLEAKSLFVICAATPPDTMFGSIGPIEVGQ